MSQLSFSLFDTHTHLAVEQFDQDRASVIERAHDHQVHEMLVVGYDLPSSRAALKVARQAPGLYASVGIQPHYAAQTEPAHLDEIRQLAQDPCVVAIGEIGLDYYRNRAPHPAQRQLLRAQLDLAHELDMPVVIHSREAFSDMLETLSVARNELQGVMHCFSGTLEEAHNFVALGLYVSIAGMVTYPRAEKTWQVAQHLTLERLLIETDCPWLAPQAHRGKRNEPAYLVEIAARIAELRGLSLEHVAQATTANAHALFLQRRTSE